MTPVLGVMAHCSYTCVRTAAGFDGGLAVLVCTDIRGPSHLSAGMPRIIRGPQIPRQHDSRGRKPEVNIEACYYHVEVDRRSESGPG